MLDLLIRNGTIHDGSGAAPYVGDVAVDGDRIVSVRPAAGRENLDRQDEPEAATTVDASGLAVAPGFVDMLSHGYLSILDDPRSLSSLKQGVTTLVFGEGLSMGPLTDEMKTYVADFTGQRRDLPWNRLSEYMAHVERSGTSQNVASFIGSFNPRMYVLGTDNRPPDHGELDRMRGLVAEEMADGALGIASALIYPPGSFAGTEELIELCRAAAPYDGVYISHMRSEGDHLLDAVDELLRISREAEVAAEIYHLKAAGQSNWPKLEKVIDRVQAARDAGEPITADMYPYRAGGTALFAAVPPRFREGELSDHAARLANPDTRAQIHEAITSSSQGWENLWQAAGGDGSGVVILEVSEESVAEYQGMSVAEIATAEGSGDPVATLLDLLERDPTIGAAYFIASRDNIRREVALPWVSFGSDAASVAIEGDAVNGAAATHPRAFGTFARVLGRYVRDERVIELREAIRRMTSFPAETLGLTGRGRVEEGCYADLVVFDPGTIADRATYVDPHQYAVGVRDVVVNGRLALADGTHTDTFPGRALRGSGRHT